MIKRGMDLFVSLLILILLLPVIVILAMLVRINLGTPSLFKQVRPGLYGKPFTIIKFRTMLDLEDKDGNVLSDEVRITKFGRFLRSTSLDELPNLLNVIKGNMSLVGPRPLLIEYLPLYTPEQARRHEVRPGITGWAQVNGRNAINWEDKFRLDVWYVDNQSFSFDMKIIFLTVKKVFQREGITGDGHVTVEPFKRSQ